MSHITVVVDEAPGAAVPSSGGKKAKAASTGGGGAKNVSAKAKAEPQVEILADNAEEKVE
jgi:hypothetical protein